MADFHQPARQQKHVIRPLRRQVHRTARGKRAASAVGLDSPNLVCRKLAKEIAPLETPKSVGHDVPFQLLNAGTARANHPGDGGDARMYETLQINETLSAVS